ncbi:MAG: hypothetical protein MJ112_00665 [Lachnospiraceae bacterium]|nr:hypothetical protein [Lachnospiraceae bacterium]
MSSNRAKLKRINYPMIILMIFLIYTAYVAFSYFNKKSIFSYEVRTGSLAKSNIYQGVAIRDEEIVTSIDTGYVEYFAREGEHVGIGDLIYSVDESGVMTGLINSESGGENSLSNEDLIELKNEISKFSSVYDNTEYSRTYDFLYSMNGMVLKLANANMLEEISKANATSDSVKLCRAEKTGYVVYNVDGMESLSVNGINELTFDNTEYKKEQLLSASLIDEGSDAYKLITSENWSIAIQLDSERAAELAEEGYVKVRFLEDQRELSGKIDVYQVLDNFYGVLSFNSSVLAYCTERFIDIEIITEEEKGLKIPVSSVVYKEFYLVPEELAIEEGEENSMYFLRKVFKEDGTLTAERINLHVYAFEDGYYYIDDQALEIGDYLLYSDMASEYPVATKGQLVGVYNMNMGYADFRRIKKLYENEEYAIVESNTVYGLREYDYIVLDSTTVAEGGFVYE